MRKPVRDFAHESVQDQQSIAKYLEALSEGLRGGQISFRTNGEEMILSPVGLMDLVLEAKCREDTSVVKIRMSWSNKPKETDAAPLIIEPGTVSDDAG